RHDLLEMDVESVGKDERIAGFQPGLDGFFVDALLMLIRHQNHGHVAPFDGVGDRHHPEAAALGLRPGGRAFPQPHDHIDTAVAEVQGMGVHLTSVADDGYAAGLDERRISVVVDVYRHALSSSLKVEAVGCQRSEVRGRKSEVGSQRSDVRSRMSEVGCQRSEVRSRMSYGSGSLVRLLTSEL